MPNGEEGDFGEETVTTSSWWGILCSLLGNLLISISLNIQKSVHVEGTAIKYYKLVRWWIGILLMILGELGNFTAYAFAPAALVAPLGTFTVISNAFIACLFFGEVFRWRDAMGIALSVVGVFLVVLVGPKTDKSVTVDELISDILETPFLTYILCITLLGLLLFAMVIVYEQETLVNILVLTSICGTYTILSAKSLASLLSSTVSGNIQLGSPFLYFLIVVLVITGLSQVHFLNLALKHYSSSEVVPTFFALFTVGAIVGSALLFNDFETLDGSSLVLFFFGCVLAFLGVYLITSNRDTENFGERASSNDDGDLESSRAALIREGGNGRTGHGSDGDGGDDSKCHDDEDDDGELNRSCFSPTFGESRCGYSKIKTNESETIDGESKTAGDYDSAAPQDTNDAHFCHSQTLQSKGLVNSAVLSNRTSLLHPSSAKSPSNTGIGPYHQNYGSYRSMPHSPGPMFSNVSLPHPHAPLSSSSDNKEQCPSSPSPPSSSEVYFSRRFQSPSLHSPKSFGEITAW
eukprot:Nk52_evm1s1794 gene=Nk52_evmTU1s1794